MVKLVKLHKWKYQDYKKIFLNRKKMSKMLRKNNAIIYDTRNSDKFYNYHLRGSINVSPIKIRKAILSNDAKSKIVLIHDFERANMSVASWARFIGYKNVFLFHLHENFSETALFKFNRMT